MVELYNSWSVAGVNASRDIMRLVATLMALFRIFGWTRTSTFTKCSLVSVLRAVERMDKEAVKTFSNTTSLYDDLRAAEAAQFCLMVCSSVHSVISHSFQPVLEILKIFLQLDYYAVEMVHVI